MGGPSTARHPRRAGQKRRQMIAEADYAAIIVALASVMLATRCRTGDRHHIAAGVHRDRARPRLTRFTRRLGGTARLRLLGGPTLIGGGTLPRVALVALARAIGSPIARAPAAIAAVASPRLLVGKRRAVDAVDGTERDVLADELGDRRDEAAVFGSGQREGAPLTARPPGTPDAVDIVLGMNGHVEIEDVRQALDVETAGRDVARHEQANLALLEALQRLGALGLRHVAMEGRGVEPVLRQRAIERVDIALAIAEDEGVLDVLAADEAAERVALALAVDDDQRLRDEGRGRGRRCHRN